MILRSLFVNFLVVSVIFSLMFVLLGTKERPRESRDMCLLVSLKLERLRIDDPPVSDVAVSLSRIVSK